MRKPVNKGTKSNPRYAGPVRYRGQQRWVPGSYPSVRAWEDAARKVVLEMQADGPELEVTIGTYAQDLWLTMNPRPKEASDDRLREGIRPLVRDFGDRRFDELPRLATRRWMVKQTVGTIKACRACWNDALDDGATTVSNPFAKPGVKESLGRKDITVLTEPEVFLLMDTCLEVLPGDYGRHFRAAVATAAFSGIRPSEKFAFRWKRYRPDEFEADIRSQFDSKGRETPPKTAAGKRTVVIPPAAVEAIAEAPRLSTEFMFCGKQGRPFTKSGLTYYWHPVRQAFLSQLPEGHQLRQRVAGCIAAGIDPARAVEGKGYMHFYELRHFGLTRFLELGGWENVMDVCGQAGHRNPQLLYSTYGHPDRAKARERLKELG